MMFSNAIERLNSFVKIELINILNNAVIPFGYAYRLSEGVRGNDVV